MTFFDCFQNYNKSTKGKRFATMANAIKGCAPTLKGVSGRGQTEAWETLGTCQGDSHVRGGMALSRRIA